MGIKAASCRVLEYTEEMEDKPKEAISLFLSHVSCRSNMCCSTKQKKLQGYRALHQSKWFVRACMCLCVPSLEVTRKEL